MPAQRGRPGAAGRRGAREFRCAPNDGLVAVPLEIRDADADKKVVMDAPVNPFGRRNVRAFLWDLLTFDRLLTGPVVHLIYWAGLALITLAGFTIIGGAVGLGIRDGSLAGVALAFATLVAGLLVVAALVLIWRGISEFYLAVFRISEDLRALRVAAEAGEDPALEAFASPGRTRRAEVKLEG
jgi:hypothetical protein